MLQIVLLLSLIVLPSSAEQIDTPGSLPSSIRHPQRDLTKSGKDQDDGEDQVAASGGGTADDDSIKPQWGYEYCGGEMEPCCDGFKCNLPGLGCQTYYSGSFVDHPVCKKCGDEGGPCCKDQCPKDGYSAIPTCSLSCNSGLTCSLQNECVSCGGDPLTQEATEPCCVDGEGNETCNTGFVCKLGQCVPCGQSNQECCIDSKGNKICDSGKVCEDDVCKNCGEETTSGFPQRCCEDKNWNPFCVVGRTCVNGLCELCGDKQEVCCVDSLGHKFCDRGRNCENNICRLCGDTNEPCCEEGAKCSNDDGARKRTCLVGSNICVNCGGDDEPCCDSIDDFPLCDPNLSCNAGRGRCEPCGNADQACCEGEPKCSVGQLCNSAGRCETCGTSGLRCCDGGTCIATIFCNPKNNRCEVCGGDGEACCPGGIVCEETLSCNSNNECE